MCALTLRTKHKIKVSLDPKGMKMWLGENFIIRIFIVCTVNLILFDFNLTTNHKFGESILSRLFNSPADEVLNKMTALSEIILLYKWNNDDLSKKIISSIT